MVSRKTNQRKAVDGKIGFVLFLVLLGIMVMTLTVVGFLSIAGDKEDEESAYENSAITEVEEEKEPEIEPEPEVAKIDLQPVVDSWAAAVGGNRSVLIYDLERGEIIGSYNVAESYNTASLYKLFVVYEGYWRLESGEWQAEDQAGSTGHTILECLDLAIRESYSPCAETLWGYIGHDALDEIVEKDFEIANSDISSLVSNPEDIMKIMRMFYEHTDITDEELVARMKDSFLNQPTTTYNWRQGLPSGFTKANVYNKVGWDWNGSSWNIYHDAAVVEFPELNRHFIVVVMTNQVSYQRIAELGGKIEGAILQQ
ncbi:serine hydrolase [Candidatus Saccharibacteria bacterium]|nr:serine hydrolase [Candidatus Saccharibacteria bacterium]